MQNDYINQDSPFLHAIKLSRMMIRYLDWILISRGFKINSLQFYVLVALSGNTTKPIQQAAISLGLTRPSLSRNVKPLIRDGYVKDISNKSQNKKSRILCTTEKGEQSIKDITPLLELENVRFLNACRKEKREFIKDMKQYQEIVNDFMKEFEKESSKND